MKPFEDVTAALQVGVRRATYQRSEYINEWPCESSEKAALVDAGALGLMMRAGIAASTSIKATAEAPAEAAIVASKAASPLIEAIDLALNDLVFEWARVADERGRVAPPAALVRLIALAAKHPELLTPILGARGRWLAELMEVRFVDNGSTLDRSELADRWQDLDWKQRADGIERLQTDLTIADEPLLDEALQDRRKEVREIAAKCLARLDQSAFSKAVVGSVRNRIRIERKLLGRQLLVEPPTPDELPKSMPRTPKSNRFGEKAHALFDALSLVRPSVWEREASLSPPDLISLAIKTDYKEALLAGWQEAAVSFEDQKWIDALFLHFLSQPATLENRRLAPLATDEVFESAYRSRLSSGLILPPRRSPFSIAFSRLVVDSAKAGNLHMEKETAASLHLSVLPSLQAPWDSPADKMRAFWYRYLDIKKRIFDSLET